MSIAPVAYGSQRHAPWADGHVRTTSSSINKRDGGVNGVQLTWEECETELQQRSSSVECYERLKGKNGLASLFQPFSTGMPPTAIIEKARADKIPVLSTAGYGRSRTPGLWQLSSRMELHADR